MKISLSALADSVLLQAEQTAVAEKTASADVSLKTDLGVAMTKVAGLLRTAPSDDITYADIATFRRAYDI